MTAYCMNKQSQANGDHEVHTYGCSYLPGEGNRHYLGEFDSCAPAVRAAKAEGYPTANGCYHCSYPCHTT